MLKNVNKKNFKMKERLLQNWTTRGKRILLETIALL